MTRARELRIAATPEMTTVAVICMFWIIESSSTRDSEDQPNVSEREAE
jgi:hypothetical protein